MNDYKKSQRNGLIHHFRLQLGVEASLGQLVDSRLHGESEGAVADVADVADVVEGQISAEGDFISVPAKIWEADAD